MNAMPKRSAMPQRSAVPLAGPKLDNRRVLAALIDVAIIGTGAALILAAAGVLGGDGSSLGAPLVGVLLCWALYYYFACESGGGQTVGKRLTNIRVLRTDGTPAGLRETGIRTVVRVVDMQFAYAVGLIAMLATGERRARLGDLAADTMVVSTDGETRQTAPAPVLPSKVIEAEELAYALDWEEPAASGPLPRAVLPAARSRTTQRRRTTRPNRTPRRRRRSSRTSSPSPTSSRSRTRSRSPPTSSSTGRAPR